CSIQADRQALPSGSHAERPVQGSRRQEYRAADAGGPRAEQASKVEARLLLSRSEAGTGARAGSNTCAPQTAHHGSTSKWLGRLLINAQIAAPRLWAIHSDCPKNLRSFIVHQNNECSKCEVVHKSPPIRSPTIHPGEFDLLAGGVDARRDHQRVSKAQFGRSKSVSSLALCWLWVNAVVGAILLTGLIALAIQGGESETTAQNATTHTQAKLP